MYAETLFAEFNAGVLRARWAYEADQDAAALAEQQKEALRLKAQVRDLARRRAVYAARKVATPNPPRRTLKPCGTNGAYIRHLRNGEDACVPCLDAHVVHNSEWRAANALQR